MEPAVGGRRARGRGAARVAAASRREAGGARQRVDSPKDRGARDFLLEIGVEEMPASACRAAIDLLPERVAGMFAAEGVAVTPDDVKVMVSPRRIAVLISQRTRASRLLGRSCSEGPAFEAAFDAEGKPTKACEGFARAKGIAPADLEVREEAGRKFVYYVTRSEAGPRPRCCPTSA